MKWVWRGCALPGNCPGRMRMGSCPGWGFVGAHGWGFARAQWQAHGYGRILPSKTLRNVPAFSRAFAQAYAQAYARAKTQAKEKVGGVIPESRCGMGVNSIFLHRQNGNGLLSFARASGMGCFA